MRSRPIQTVLRVGLWVTLVTVVTARPEYNYPRSGATSVAAKTEEPEQNWNGDSLLVKSSTIRTSEGDYLLRQGQQGQQVQQGQQSQQLETSSSQTVQQQSRTQKRIIDEYNKVFYTFTPPKEKFIDQSLNRQIEQIRRRNLQVIFIHTPEQPSVEDALRQLVQQFQEQRTNIYVLSKQVDLDGLGASLSKVEANIVRPPDVQYIKYRTDEEAERSKQTIRAQYAKEGGTTSEGGQREGGVLNFITNERAQVTAVTENRPKISIASGTSGTGAFTGAFGQGGSSTSLGISVTSSNSATSDFGDNSGLGQLQKISIQEQVTTDGNQLEYTAKAPSTSNTNTNQQSSTYEIRPVAVVEQIAVSPTIDAEASNLATSSTGSQSTSGAERIPVRPNLEYLPASL